VGFQAERQKIKLRDPNLALNEYEIFKKIRGDSRRYLQIMINFLSNALKFSNRSSEIRINIRLNEMIAKAQSAKESVASMPSKESLDEIMKPKPKEKCFFINFEIEVQDFGCGIPVDVQSEVGKGTKFIINFKTVCMVSSERTFLEFRKQPRFKDQIEPINISKEKLAVIGSLIRGRLNPRKKKSM